jgi:hypothetical protein
MKPYEPTRSKSIERTGMTVGMLVGLLMTIQGSAARHPSPGLPNWWTDDPSPELAEGPHIGARTVRRWRVTPSRV